MLIDTLEAKNRLVEEGGMDERQAEGVVNLIASTRARPVSAALLKEELDAFEKRLTRKMYGGLFLAVTVLGALSFFT